MEEIQIETEFIRLDALLKWAGLVDTGGQAKAAIQQGMVEVNGAPCLLRGKKLYPGDTLAAAGRSFVVARAGEEQALCPGREEKYPTRK